MLKFYTYVFSFGLVFSSGLYAESITPHQLVKINLDKIESKGATKIGDIPISKLKEDFTGVKLLELPGAGFTVGSNGRLGGLNLTEQKTVILSPLVLKQNSLTQNRVLLTHEFLEANGYDDENYQITSMIEVLAKENEPQIKNQQYFGDYKSPTRRTANRKSSITTENGTTTGVGGGGDGIAAEAKSILLALILPKLTNQETGDGSDLKNAKFSLLNLKVENDISLESPYQFSTNGHQPVLILKPYTIDNLLLRDEIEKQIMKSILK